MKKAALRSRMARGKPVARLTPEVEKACTGRDLAEALRKADLSASEAQSWHKDLVAARKKLSAPRNKWQ